MPASSVWYVESSGRIVGTPTCHVVPPPAIPRSAPTVRSAISRSRASRRPRAPRRKRDAPIFVVQKHQAHRAGLHWDFRLEHDGVLWSWAVRKGPSLDPADKRIAVHVEDHPLDYADFEGSIPDGQYGAGNVELWDRGTWQPLDDPEAGMRKGELEFVLDGKRLHGRFTLVRLKPRPGPAQPAGQLAADQGPRRRGTRGR